jgi:hypothetical protein
VQQKLQERAFVNVEPFLRAGEKPVVAARAMVGKFGSGRLGAVALQGVVLEGGGAVLAATLAATRKQYVVVTDRRLIFLPQTILGGPGKKLLGEVPRNAVSLVEAKWGIVSLLRVSFGAESAGVALTFPRVDRKNAEALAAVLPTA